MKLITIPKPVEGFQTQSLDGEIVLLHPVRNIIIHINQTGALIWELCDCKRTVDEIIELLSAAYPDARDAIAEDVPETIQTLVKEGALKSK
ncbi:MAG: PqqD family protein [Chloroflexi bacterium]|nr:PqqD family protein [Chloroflexota bacterium]